MKNFLLFLFAVASFNIVYSQTSIIPYGASWKYLDNGTNQGTTWSSVAFNDAAWASGLGQLGYGDGDESTIVSFGPNANAKYITTYFRKSINIANPAAFSLFSANIKRDDGVVVYVNGNEVFRNNLPAGVIAFNTLASAAAADDGATPQPFSIPLNAFVSGNNVIAVEIHQNAINSSDISFDMQLVATPVPVNTTIVPFGSAWKYKDNGVNLGILWQAVGYNDLLWASGNGQLGFGDGDESTVVSYGPDTLNKYSTTYFRKTITIPDTSQFAGYTISLKRDDGAIVYINNKEVFRSNMPDGKIAYSSKASTEAADDGNTAQTKLIPLSFLKQGTNVIAVEVHQNKVNSPDLSFDLQLKAFTPAEMSNAALTRGPYMNTATQSSIVIRWRTNVATNTVVSYGTTASSLTKSYVDVNLTTEHIATLTGLTTNTLYYYSIGTSTQILQGNASNYFKTMPAAGSTTQKIRILAMGDMGNNSANQIAVRDAWLSFNGNTYTNAWILLGDNAYNSGTDAEYQSNFYDIYQGSLTKNHVLWPAPGNHDYANSAARQADHAIPYYDMFTLPSAGQAGGVASNTEAFYSYNYGNVHFVALDSYGWETGSTRLYDTLGPQAVWLKRDLAANRQPWVIVYFHHPPYTKGSHNSDLEPELISMRQNIVPILERYKVDLVLNGHSHSYERSLLINGHYGVESTFNPATNALSTSSAKYDGSANSCFYSKNTTATRNGIVYAVVGSAGQLGGQSPGFEHNAMYYSDVTNGGALYLEIENNRLNAKWICADGVVRDNFTIMKNVGKTTTVNISAGGTVTLTASWIGNYTWSTGARTRSVSITPAASTTYTVTDSLGCVTDVFNIGVSRPASVKQERNNLMIYPTIIKSGQTVQIRNYPGENMDIVLMDINGRIVKRTSTLKSSIIETMGLIPGTYFIRWNDRIHSGAEKIMITR